jgi:uncharacterized protein
LIEAAGATFLGGLVLGFSSTLHCSAMCAGISCSSLLLLNAETGAARVRHAALVHTGRIAAYAILGAIAAAAGSLVLSPHATISYKTMQWAAAAALMWSGLVLAGFAPRMTVLDGAMMRLSDAFSTWTRPLRSTPDASALVLGGLWGLNPCPMVYGAIFAASLTGSVPLALAMMAGFGLGTLPGVVASGAGLSALQGVKSQPYLQSAIGLFIAAVGFATVYLPAAYKLPFCLTN